MYTFAYATEAEWRISASVNETIIGSDNGLSPICHQAIIWTNDNIVNGNIKSMFHWNTVWNSKIFIQENTFENFVREMSIIVSRP